MIGNDADFDDFRRQGAPQDAYAIARNTGTKVARRQATTPHATIAELAQNRHEEPSRRQNTTKWHFLKAIFAARDASDYIAFRRQIHRLPAIF